jgi:hypothetical protein
MGTAAAAGSARVGVKLNALTPANKHAKSCCELKHRFIKRREPETNEAHHATETIQSVAN